MKTNYVIPVKDVLPALGALGMVLYDLIRKRTEIWKNEVEGKQEDIQEFLRDMRGRYNTEYARPIFNTLCSLPADIPPPEIAKAKEILAEINEIIQISTSYRLSGLILDAAILDLITDLDEDVVLNKLREKI